MSPQTSTCPKCQAANYILVHCERGVGVWYCTKCQHVANVTETPASAEPCQPVASAAQETAVSDPCPLCGKQLLKQPAGFGWLRCASCDVQIGGTSTTGDKVKIIQKDCSCMRWLDLTTKTISCERCTLGPGYTVLDSRLMQHVTQYAAIVKKDQETESPPGICCRQVFRDTDLAVNTFWHAASCNNVAVLKFMRRVAHCTLSWNKLSSNVEDRLLQVIQRGSLDALQWLHQRYNVREYMGSKALHAAYVYKRSTVVQWLKDTFGLSAEADTELTQVYLDTFDVAGNTLFTVTTLYNRFGMTLRTALLLLAKQGLTRQQEKVQRWILLHIMPTFGLDQHFLHNMNGLGLCTFTYQALADPKKELSPPTFQQIRPQALKQGLLDAFIWLSLIHPSFFTASYTHLRRIMESGHVPILEWYCTKYKLDPRECASFLQGCPPSTVQWYVQVTGVNK